MRDNKKYSIISILIIVILLLCSYNIYANATDKTVSPVLKQVVLASENNLQMKKITPTTASPVTTYEGYEMIATLNVPSIGIEYPVLATTSAELMKVSLNKYWGGNPNEVGNFCIVGHNYKSGKHFGKLKYVNIGDKVYLTDNSGRTLTYEVYDRYVIDPYDTRCTSQLTEGRKEVTLITCSNAGENRLVVKAREI